MANTKVFSSEKLEEAYARVQNGLENYQTRLDGVSNDIKTLERALEASKFNLETWVTVREYCEDPQSNGQYDQIGHQIGWAPSGDRYRLMYRRSRWEGYLEVDDPGSTLPLFMYAPGTYGKYEPEVVKPLIETPIEIRLEMHEHLPKLVTAVGKAVDPEIARQAAEETEKANLERLKAVWGEGDRAKTERESKKAKPGANGADPEQK